MLEAILTQMATEKPRDKCGLFGVYSQNLHAARIVHPGLFALQHRGQESSGIVACDSNHFNAHRGMGLMTKVYAEKDIEDLTGHFAIGHNRYSTSKRSTIDHAQPIISDSNSLVLAHNGNLPNTLALKEFLQKKGEFCEGHNDSELMTDTIDHYVKRGAGVEEAIIEAYPLLHGAFSLLILTPDKLIAVRDSNGIRPLSMGKLDGATLFSSETCAFDTTQAEYSSDVRPGEMVILSESGQSRHQIATGRQKFDLFEFIYFSRPDSYLLGQSVYSIRYRMGQELWQENPVKADLVIGVPDSAIPAALGFAAASGISYGEGLTKNRYIHRTFIQPEQRLRERGVAMKLNVLKEQVRGKRLVLIDDSIVRGNTVGSLLKRLRDAGATEVHVRISSPPYLYPDLCGVDTPEQSGLIAARMKISEIKDYIGADSLGYLSLSGTIKATGLPEDCFYTGPFTGDYPFDIGEAAKNIKRVTLD